MILVHAEVARNIKNAADKINNKGVDNLIDSYEINESLKKFNNILAEVGGSL